ncbi:MAG: YnbE family lipoprotein [Rhodospirillaceae bacterium]
MSIRRNRRSEIRANRGLTPWALSAMLLGGLLTGGCEPTVKVAAPEKPITINLNVKIEHEVRVRLEKDVDDLLKKKSDLF